MAEMKKTKKTKRKKKKSWFFEASLVFWQPVKEKKPRKRKE